MAPVQGKQSSFRIGIDIGGTFTDVVAQGADGEVRLAKLPTTRGKPADAVKGALKHISEEWGIDPSTIVRFTHGTTAATNAVLERAGAKIGLITTAGFRDVLEIGREHREEMYDLVLRPQTPVFLAPRAFRKEALERIGPEGEVIIALDEHRLGDTVRELVADGVEAIAVCFLFSFLNPEHELRAREIILDIAPDIKISLSCEVDPGMREYERTAVTAFDAYVKPVLDRYLTGMSEDLSKSHIPASMQVMQSRGGLSAVDVARLRPVRLFLSGPAAGVIGGRAAGVEAGFQNLITMDVGGTSCDVALISNGSPHVHSESLIDGYSVRVPTIDINAVGAGGGSIAWVDDAGSLKVGPRSAGSEPGPACYGRGGVEPTVTDASIVLGYIDPAYFAGGSFKLDPALSRAVILGKIARPLGISVEAAALGIHRVVNAQMAEGIRLVSVRRGIDPRGYALVSMGGGGGLHANALARELKMASVVIPRSPGVLSAQGLLSAPVEHEISISFQRKLTEVSRDDIAAALASLDERCTSLMAYEGSISQPTIRHYADVCYVGQSYHLEIPVSSEGLDRVYDDFLAMHDRTYGYSVDGAVRFVNLRAVHSAFDINAANEKTVESNVAGEPKAYRTIVVPDFGAVNAAVWDRLAISPNSLVEGPAIIDQPDTTVLIEPGWRARVKSGGSLVIELSVTGA